MYTSIKVLTSEYQERLQKLNAYVRQLRLYRIDKIYPQLLLHNKRAKVELEYDGDWSKLPRLDWVDLQKHQPNSLSFTPYQNGKEHKKSSID